MPENFNSAPFEIIAAPFTIYLAPTGTAFPDIGEDPSGDWFKIGTSGDENYNEEGVKVSHTQTIEKTRTLGTTAPRKAFRTAEDLMIGFQLHDMTLEQYNLAIEGSEVQTVAAGTGVAGRKSISAYRGFNLPTHALLARGNFSAYGNGMNTQYEVPVCYQSGSPEPVFVKGSPAGLSLEYTALINPDATGDDDRFGRLVVQHQLPLV